MGGMDPCTFKVNVYNLFPPISSLLDKKAKTMWQKSRLSQPQFLEVVESFKIFSCYGKCFLVKGAKEHNVWFVQCVFFPFFLSCSAGEITPVYSAFISLRCFLALGLFFRGGVPVCFSVQAMMLLA